MQKYMEPSADHPIRWEAKGDPNDVAYITMEEALHRLSRDEPDPEAAKAEMAQALSRGYTLQTSFAHYSLWMDVR